MIMTLAKAFQRQDKQTNRFIRATSEPRVTAKSKTNRKRLQNNVKCHCILQNYCFIINRLN